MRRGLPSVAVEAGILSLFWALGTVFFKSAGLSSYKLFVDGESITGVSEYTGWMGRLLKRTTIRKGRVQTIFEIKATAFHPGGSGVSERSMLGARMLGWVFLPKDLPELRRATAIRPQRSATWTHNAIPSITKHHEGVNPDCGRLADNVP
jgi:hypothetical protein